MSEPAPKRKPGRPPGARNRPISEIQRETADLLDKEMRRVLREGVTALDHEGNVVRLTPSAAMLSAITKRLRDIANAAKRGGHVSDEAAGFVRDAMARGVGGLRLTSDDDRELAHGLERLGDALTSGGDGDERDPEDDLVAPRKRGAG